MKQTQSWTHTEEKALVKYVKLHRDRQNLVNWNEIADYLPQKTMSQITSKYFRMKNDLTQRWNFEQEGIETPPKSQRIRVQDCNSLVDQIICLMGY